MSKALESEILKESISIGNDIVNEVLSDENGLYWKNYDLNGSAELHASENLYMGSAGIALFLLELYKKTKNKTYLKTANEALRWIDAHCQSNNPGENSFITGRMGVSYLFLRFYQSTGKKENKEKALELAKQIYSNSTYSTVSDYLGGTAGTILYLLILHSSTKKKWILKYVDKLISKLLSEIFIGKRGVYWDRVPDIITGLCGFSHGVAGIGYVLLELGYYFKNPAFFWLAEQGFLYESVFYNTKTLNWPDFRKKKYYKKDYKTHIKEYTAGNYEFFKLPGDMNAWCHGAAGVGMSRIRAYELLKKEIYRKEILRAVKKTKLTDIDNFSFFNPSIYCHGSAGNAELFLETYKTFKKNEYRKLALNVAQNMLIVKKKYGKYFTGHRNRSKNAAEDNTLFLGKAGIGYFFLRLLDQSNIPSVLLPKLNSCVDISLDLATYKNITIDIGELRKIICKKTFKNTVDLAERIYPKKVNNYFKRKDNRRIDEQTNFTKFINKEIRMLGNKEKEILKDSFYYESQKKKLNIAIESNALLDIKRIMHNSESKKLLYLTEKLFLETHLIIDTSIKLCETKWNWVSNIIPRDIYGAKGKFTTLLKQTPEGINANAISYFVSTLIGCFRKPQLVKKVVSYLSSAYKQEERVNVEIAIIKQIKELIIYGVLKENET